jgi:hypothetical protein
MLLRVNKDTRKATRVKGERLSAFGLDERGLQDILFRSLDRLLPDEELLPIAQSLRGQEEPDILALDKDGKLYIFELKIWEARSENLLQALRYGQIFGNHDYERLDQLFRRSDKSGHYLKAAHEAKFNVSLKDKEFNSKQVFVVLTNGLDFRTREAIQYWVSAGLDVRAWVYRIYRYSESDFLIEMPRFGVRDNPYEDVDAAFYILNTNYRYEPADHEDMIRNSKVAAYGTPWKHKIENLDKGDTVFLYQSGVGVVAMGVASGTLSKANYHGDPNQRDEEYSMSLERFQLVDPPVSAAKIKEIAGANYRFLGTMFSIDADSGTNLKRFIEEQTSV